MRARHSNNPSNTVPLPPRDAERMREPSENEQSAINVQPAFRRSARLCKHQQQQRKRSIFDEIGMNANASFEIKIVSEPKSDPFPPADQNNANA